MKALYITAVVTYSGKTALAAGIGLKLQEAGHKVGYFKPVSTQPFFVNGKLVDEDAEFITRTLHLDTPLSEMSSVVVDDAMLDSILEGRSNREFLKDVEKSYAKLSVGKDVLIVEGGGSMREGTAINLSAANLVTELKMPTLGVVRYRDGLMLIDDILSLKTRLGDHVLGVVINAVPPGAMEYAKAKIGPFLEKNGVRVYGVLPHDQSLMSLTVSELVSITSAKVLVEGASKKLVENLSVGAMSVESALPRFRRTLNKAVITGGDRADIQAAALETSTVALVLTGNLQPNSTVLQRAEENGVAVLMVPGSTMETVEAVEKVFGKTRMGSPEKLTRFLNMIDTHLDTARLFKDMGL
jgi:BioD-like phosphotransacetylase family protein